MQSIYHSSLCLELFICLPNVKEIHILQRPHKSLTQQQPQAESSIILYFKSGSFPLNPEIYEHVYQYHLLPMQIRLGQYIHKRHEHSKKERMRTTFVHSKSEIWMGKCYSGVRDYSWIRPSCAIGSSSLVHHSPNLFAELSGMYLIFQGL